MGAQLLHLLADDSAREQAETRDERQRTSRPSHPALAIVSGFLRRKDPASDQTPAAPWMFGSPITDDGAKDNRQIRQESARVSIRRWSIGESDPSCDSDDLGTRLRQRSFGPVPELFLDLQVGLGQVPRQCVGIDESQRTATGLRPVPAGADVSRREPDDVSYDRRLDLMSHPHHGAGVVGRLDGVLRNPFLPGPDERVAGFKDEPTSSDRAFRAAFRAARSSSSSTNT